MILHVLPVPTDDDVVLLIRQAEHNTIYDSFMLHGGQLTNRDHFFSALKWYVHLYDDVIVHVDQSSLQ